MTADYSNTLEFTNWENESEEINL